MTGLNPADYPPPLRELLAVLPLAPLGPGRPDPAVRASLEALTDAALGEPIVDHDMASCCRAGLWLAFNYLDEAHEISQGLHTVEGSYWHAILHRREPDAANAGYWFRRVGEHPIFPALAKEARDLGLQLRSERWDPFEFINLCESSRGSGTPQEMRLRQVQQREWELLFDWCYSRMVERR